jgi:glutathione peroxidase
MAAMGKLRRPPVALLLAMVDAARMTTLHDFKVRTIDGNEQRLGDFSGKALLVVNVASRCGLTPQYEALEALHKKYAAKGFAVLGFPCNDFGAQEPGTEAEIKTFCTSKYDVSFPLFAKVKVLGDDKAQVFDFLTKADAAPKGAGDITWNFEKFLVGKDGKVLARFAPPTAPLDPEITSAIDRALGRPSEVPGGG